jgi:hypothetical protein
MTSYILTRPVPFWKRLLNVLIDRRPTAGNVPAVPIQELEGLSDSLLEDIGIDPRSVPRPSQEAAVSLGLSERGWIPGRR